MKVQVFTPAMWLVLVGSLATAQEEEEARSYDVSGIVAPSPDSEFLIAPQGNLVLLSTQYDSRAPLDMPLFGNERLARVKWDEAEGEPQDPAAREAQRIGSRGAELVEFVSQQLHAAGLPVEGEADGQARLRYHSGVLFIQGPAPVQEKVKSVLAPLLERARRLVHVRCLLVPQEVLEGIEPRWREAGPYLAAAVFQKALLDGRSRLLSAVARSGQKLTTGSKDLRAFVVDHEINQTGVIPVSNPVVDVPFAGDRLQVRPFFLGGKDLLLDLAVGRFRVSAAPSKLGAEWSDLDLPVTDETLLSTTFRLRAGEAYVAGSLGGEGGTVVMVEADAGNARGGSTAAPQEEGERFLRTFDVHPLLRNNDGRRWWEDRRPWRALDQAPEQLTEVLVGLVGGAGAFGEENFLTYYQGLMFLFAPREMQDKVARHLQAELARATELAAVDLDLLEVSRETYQRLVAESEDGFLLKAGWRAVLEADAGARRTSYTVVGIAGEGHALRLARIRSVVTDVESVSGGTGFAIIERPDPVVQACGQGVELRLQVDFPPGADGARLFLEGADARDLKVHNVLARFPSVAGVMTALPGQEPTLQPGPVAKGLDVIKEIQLNLPEQKVSFWDLERELPLDREVILQADAPEGEMARLLVARVRKLR